MLLISEHSTKHFDKKIIYQSPSLHKEFEVIQEKESIGKGTYMNFKYKKAWFW